MHNVKHKMYFYKIYCIICNTNAVGVIRLKHEQAVIFQENRRITNVLRIAEHVLLYMYKSGITGKWSGGPCKERGWRQKYWEGDRYEKENGCRICNPIKIVGNIQPGLTRTVKSWIIVSKTANRLQEEKNSQVWISSHASEKAIQWQVLSDAGIQSICRE